MLAPHLQLNCSTMFFFDVLVSHGHVHSKTCFLGPFWYGASPQLQIFVIHSKALASCGLLPRSLALAWPSSTSLSTRCVSTALGSSTCRWGETTWQRSESTRIAVTPGAWPYALPYGGLDPVAAMAASAGIGLLSQMKPSLFFSFRFCSICQIYGQMCMKLELPFQLVHIQFPRLWCYTAPFEELPPMRRCPFFDALALGKKYVAIGGFLRGPGTCSCNLVRDLGEI